MALTDTEVKNAKPAIKKTKLFDGGGLFLEVSPKGGKWWRFKYRYAGKEKLLSLGVYPDVKLKLARERRDEMRKLLTVGVDPSQNRKAKKEAHLISTANSFEVVALEWHQRHAQNLEPSHAERILRRLQRDLFPWIGNRPILEITPIEILKCIRRIEERGAIETAHRALQNCSQIFRYAVVTGRVQRDPTTDLRGAIPPSQTKHFAAVTEPKRAGELLRAFEGYEGTFVVKCALKIAPLVFVRPGELRKAEWADIDFESCEWRYKVTKTKTQHIVPLSSQAISILKELHLWLFFHFHQHLFYLLVSNYQYDFLFRQKPFAEIHR